MLRSIFRNKNKAARPSGGGGEAKRALFTDLALMKNLSQPIPKIYPSLRKDYRNGTMHIAQGLLLSMNLNLEVVF